MNEADTIGAMSVRYLERYRSANIKAQSFVFTLDFKKCCLEAVRDLRAEALCRLMPAAKIPEEDMHFTRMMDDGPSDSYYGKLISPYSVSEYSPYLRKLGVQVLRLTIPRHAPIAVRFAETPKPLGIEITITPRSGIISTGYLVVDVNDLGAKLSGIVSEFVIIAPFDAPTIANDDLVDYLQTHPSAFALRLRKDRPLSWDNPAIVSVRGSTTFHVLSAKVFDE